MTGQTAILAHEPIAIPGPVWLMYGLLLLLFVVHVLPMSVTLGGGFWAILATRKGRTDSALRLLAERMGRWLPVWTAATVSSGVAALLFLQVLYGQQFYAASVAIAWPWLGVLGLVVAGYYGYYFRSLRASREPRAAFWVGVLAWLAFVAAAFVFTNQMTLMLRPEQTHLLYAADPTGASLNLGDPTLIPRALHMLLGAISLAALWAAYLGARTVAGGDRSNGERMLTWSIHGLLVVLGLQVLGGFWFLFSLPDRQWLAFMGGDSAGTVGFALSLLATPVGAWSLWRARRAAAPLRLLIIGAGSMLFVMVLMVVMRDALRRATLSDAVHFDTVPVAPQWGVIALFIALLVAGVIAIAWMLRAAARGRAGVGLDGRRT